MANFLDKFKITTAWESNRHTKDLSCEHVTTADFMQLSPVYYHNTIPKEKLEVNFRAFARLAPMPVPTFGRANMNMRAFFVPFRTIQKDWNHFITDSIHTYPNNTAAIPSSVRRVSNYALVNFLAIRSQVLSNVQEPASYDFAVQFPPNQSYPDGIKVWYKLMPQGRVFLRTLEQLGYHLCFDLRGDDFYYNALPILAFAKIISDWYWPSQYQGLSNDFNFLTRVLERDVNGDVITDDEIARIFDCAWANYDSDYFVSAFDNPAGPATGVASDINIQDVNDIYGDRKVTSDGSSESYGYHNNTPVYIDESGSGLLSQYALEALHRLSDYMKRHQLAGARALDRYLARFGVNLSSEKLNRSIYLGSHKVPLMTGDVMSTSDTLTASQGSRLGDYAGKGYLVGQDGHFEFETDEYGIFIIMSSIIPEVGYYQGIDRHNLHLSRLDFLTPEFDGMGTRAIVKSEAYLSFDATEQDKKNTKEIFGYTPQYSEYKIGRDWLTGDFRLGTLNAAGDTSEAWHLFRDLSQTFSDPVHNIGFVRGMYDNSQYNRIFYDTENNADHFYLHYFFGVKSTANLLPLYDEYDFHNEDKAEKRVMDVNGVKMN